MSARHPIIAVTGSSGAGTSTARRVFERLFDRLGVKAAYVEGDSFHAYDREQMGSAIERARIRGENFSHFGPGANHLDKLEQLFRSYSETGTGMARRYLHTETEAIEAGQSVGTFTPWAPLATDSDLLLYEGLHGGVVTNEVDVAQYVDLLIGVTPTVNLEWIQKIRRDADERGHTPKDVTRTILRRMPDYVKFITPQFSRTDINFQRVPLVDTSNPFVIRDIPKPEESLVVVHLAPNSRVRLDMAPLCDQIPNVSMTRPDTLVVPGTHMGRAMELILEPAIRQQLSRRMAVLEG